MKHAAAMKYGGELVAAEDCTYDSFKELVPLCPNCKEPVFLRIGGDRLSVKGNEYMVGPHWCHFKGVSAEQIAGCEARVSGYTESDRQRIAAKAKGQRLKLLQRWFWGLYVRQKCIENPGLTAAEFNKLISDLKSEAGGCSNGKVIAIVDSISHAMSTPTDIDPLELVEDIVVAGVSDLKCGLNESERQNGARFLMNMSKIDRAMHSKIMKEVAAFLSTKGSCHLLYDIVLAKIFQVSTMPGDEVVLEILAAGTNTSGKLGMAMVLREIAPIPWAAEFQRLEAEAKQRKDAA